MTTITTMTAPETDREHRDRILSALLIYAQQKPRLEYGNYGDPVAYRAEVRRITRDLSYARDLLRAARDSAMTSAQLVEAFRNSRLSWDGEKLDYITGQYWPTEYRPAVCRVIASALWCYFSDNGASATVAAIYARIALPARLVRRWFQSYTKRNAPL